MARLFLVLALAASWPATGPALAQFPEHPQALHSPAKVKGFIGGESHDTYVIEARQGQIMTVRISWSPKHDKEAGADTNAQFWVRPRQTLTELEMSSLGSFLTTTRSGPAQFPRPGSITPTWWAFP